MRNLLDMIYAEPHFYKGENGTGQIIILIAQHEITVFVNDEERKRLPKSLSNLYYLSVQYGIKYWTMTVTCRPPKDDLSKIQKIKKIRDETGCLLPLKQAKEMVETGRYIATIIFER